MAEVNERGQFRLSPEELITFDDILNWLGLKREAEKVGETEEESIVREKLEELRNTLPPEQQKRIDEIREYLQREFGDFVADIISALLSGFLALLQLASFGMGYGFGLFDVWRIVGQRQALREMPIYIPQPSEIARLIHAGQLDEREGRELAKEYGVSDYWFDKILFQQKTLVSPETVRELYRRKFISTDTAFQLLKLHGFDHVQASLFLGLAYQRLSVAEAVNLWLRGEITEQYLDEILDINGYLPHERELVKKLAFIIPPVSDIIRFAVREAFNPEAIQQFQLLSEFPEEFAKYAQMQGLSRFWAERYWIAHWELPSITQAFEMFHRTVPQSTDPNADVIAPPSGWETRVNPPQKQNVIGRETLRMLLKAQDISPFWRDKLEAISYLPLTRVDVRRAYELGILGEGDVYFAYRDLGYNDQNAQILTQFTILEVMNEERNKVRNEILELFILGAINETELREALKQLRFPDRVVEALVQFARFRKWRKYIERIIKRYKAEYMRGDIDDSEAHDRLVRLGLESEEVLRILEEWQAEKIAKERTLTKEDIRRAFERRLISEQEAREKLKRLGYSDEDIELLIRIWR